MDIHDETGVRWHTESSEEGEEGEEQRKLLDEWVKQLTIEEEGHEEAQRKTGTRYHGRML